jgi:hypothetical protein
VAKPRCGFEVPAIAEVIVWAFIVVVIIQMCPVCKFGDVGKYFGGKDADLAEASPLTLSDTANGATNAKLRDTPATDGRNRLSTRRVDPLLNL